MSDQELIREFRAELRNDFGAFTARCFAELHSKPLMMASYIEVMTSRLVDVHHGKIKRLIMNVPPRHLKIIDRLERLPGLAPRVEAVEPGYVCQLRRDLAQSFARDTRTIMTSDWYQRLFPETRLISPRAALDDLITTKNGGRYALLELTRLNRTRDGLGQNVLARGSVAQSGVRVNDVVVLHPAIDECKGCSSVRDQRHPNVVSLECLHERLCHAVALGAFDRRKARHQVEGQGDLHSSMGGEDRAVVGEPLHRMRSANCAKALLDAPNHHIADHLAGDAGGRRHPGDGFAVMAIECEGDAHHLAVPTREFQCIRAPAAIRPDRRDLAIVLAHSSASSVPFEQQPMFLH